MFVHWLSKLLVLSPEIFFNLILFLNHKHCISFAKKRTKVGLKVTEKAEKKKNKKKRPGDCSDSLGRRPDFLFSTKKH